MEALARLDADPEVDVIVIARGGGSVEDLLPFSDEALCRAVSGCRTPVVSAIGHEPDNPIVDDVADVRCSTPTDAGKRVVPDVAEETARVRQLRDRGRRALPGWVDAERPGSTRCSAAVLADPLWPIQRRLDDVEIHRERGRRAMLGLLAKDQAEIAGARGRLTALGPAATMARGYAVVQFTDDAGNLQVLRSVSQVEDGARLRVRIADGAIHAVTESTASSQEGDWAVTTRAPAFLPLTVDAAARLDARALLHQARVTDSAASECWTALLAGCGTAARGRSAPSCAACPRPRPSTSAPAGGSPRAPTTAAASQAPRKPSRTRSRTVTARSSPWPSSATTTRWPAPSSAANRPATPRRPHHPRERADGTGSITGRDSADRHQRGTVPDSPVHRNIGERRA